MNKENAERVITAFLKPIFGFALKRCKNAQDAEDLSQEIVMKAYRALLVKDDIEDESKFIWTIAHNTLSNYYRDCVKSVIGISIDEIGEYIADPESDIVVEDGEDPLHRLQSEIAYLSKIQRKILILYYFENKKQSGIAKELNIPLGTVKWHLFEAKKELKRGMDTMRKNSELKFNPIKFHSYGINGSPGTKSPDEIFRSTISQNICYCVRNSAKTLNEIADDLGVSPVYVESEVEYLEKYAFLKQQNGKYIVNFIISEPTAELLVMQDAMYKKAAGLFANELYDELISCGILDDENIVCGQTDLPISLTKGPKKDRNFVLWSLIPYIAANSGKNLMNHSIYFEEVATIRPNGGYNIFRAAVIPDDLILPDDYVYMKNWCGPMWSNNEENVLWQIDSEWSDRDEDHKYQYAVESKRILSLYKSEEEIGILSKDDYAWLSERGYIKTNGDYEGYFKSSWQIVQILNKTTKNKLLAIGDKIKSKHKDTFDSLKKDYTNEMLKSVPTHLKKIMEYELQFIFHSDGWFLLHCIVTLLNNEKLKKPTEGQRKPLTTLIVTQ